MALEVEILGQELENLTPTSTPGVVEQRLAEAYGVYMSGAEAGGIEIEAAPIDALAVPAMAAAMTFSAGSTSAQGAAVVTAGVTAFWAAMSASPALFFAGATVITPPPFAGLTAALAAAFDANTAGSVTLAQAAEAIAQEIHDETVGLGTVTFTPNVQPIT